MHQTLPKTIREKSESQEPRQQRNGWTIVYNNNKAESLYWSSLFTQRKSKYDSKYYCEATSTSSTTFWIPLNIIANILLNAYYMPNTVPSALCVLFNLQKILMRLVPLLFPIIGTEGASSVAQPVKTAPYSAEDISPGCDPWNGKIP